MNRRNVLKLGLSSTALSWISQSALSMPWGDATPSIATSGDISTLVKHGTVKADQKLAWSMMHVSDVDSFLTRVNNILDSYRYQNELKYSSTDRYKIDPSKRIIDLIYDFAGNINFTVVLFNTNPSSFRNVSPTEFNSRLNTLYREVMSNQTGGNVISKSEDRFGPSKIFQEYFVNSYGVENSPINAKNNKIIQVNDLVSGIIYSIFATGNIRSRTKVEINNYFKLVFNFPDSLDSDTFQNGPFTIRKIDIRF